MSPADLIAKGGGNIRQASPSESFPHNEIHQGRRGTTLAVDSDVVLISGFENEGINYNALYYFKADRLIMVALVPPTVEQGFQTSKLLDLSYGTPISEDRMGRDENYTGGGTCIVRRRWKAARDGNLVTFFNMCGTRFQLRYEPLPGRSGL
jgi:hypothetical protein